MGANLTEYDYCDRIDLEAHTFIIRGILCAILIVFGVVANIVVIGVLTRRNYRCTTSLYLIVVAALDILALLLFGVYSCVDVLSSKFEWLPGHRLSVLASPIVDPLAEALFIAGVYTLLLAAFERVLSLLCPQVASRVCSKLFAVVAVALLAVFAVAFALVYVFVYAVDEDAMCAEDAWNKHSKGFTRLVYNAYFQLIYLEILHPVIGGIVPYLWSIVAIVLIVAALIFRAKRTGWHGAVPPVHLYHSKQMAYMVLAIVIVHLATALPYIVGIVVIWTGAWRRIGAAPRIILIDVVPLLHVINASVKLPLYAAASGEFRRQLCGGGTARADGEPIVHMQMDDVEANAKPACK